MLRLILTAILLLGVSACQAETPGRSGAVNSVGTANIGGPFILIDETGATVTEAALTGKPHLVYFGFTYCPDICPTALQKMGAAQELLGAQGDKIGYVLISVDPERDTPESLSQYITAGVFPGGLRGFTGSVKQIEVAKNAYKVFAQKTLTPESAGEYTVDHSDIMYLMDSKGEFAEYFSGRSTPQDIAMGVRRVLKKQ
jgi:protein SCO1/2